MRAYVLSAALADELRRQALEWERFDLWSMGIQLVRAADSVAANIAESTGRHYLDRRRLLYTARGSLAETAHWIARATARGLIAKPEPEGQVEEIGRLLNGLIKRTTRFRDHRTC